MKPILTNPMKLYGILLLFFSTFTSYSQPHFTLDINQKGVDINSCHYRVFFEDINRAYISSMQPWVSQKFIKQ